MKLTPRQRELLIEVIDRGAVKIPYGAASRPHRALRAKGLVKVESRSQGYHGSQYVSVATNAGINEIA